MNSKEVVSLAQIISTMKTAAYGIQKAQREGDTERFVTLKKEFLALQEKVEKLL